MNRRLVLHAGHHKTGTTSIQYALDLNRVRLAGVDWTYGTLPGRQASHSLFHPPGDSFSAHPGGGLTTNQTNARMIFGQDPTRHVVCSAEGASYLLAAEAVEEFVSVASEHFDTIDVVLFVRRQDRLAVSHKAQGARTLAAGLIYGHSLDPLPAITPTVRHYLSFDQTVDRWATLIGRDHVHIELHKPGRDSVPALARHLGGCEFLTLARPDWQNTTVDAVTAQAGHQLKRELGDRAGTKLAMHLTPTGNNRLLPTLREAQRFAAEFDESNARLGNLIGVSSVFDNDFGQYATTRQTVDAASIERAIAEAKRSRTNQLPT